MSKTSEPRWKVAIDNALEKDKSATIYQLATLSAPQNTPRVRSLVHRAFLAPRTPAQPLLLTTTDVRSAKAHDLARDARVELAWWVAGTQEQFRIAGRAHVFPSARVGGPDGDAAPEYAAARALARAFGVEGAVEWEAKRVEVFDGLSAHMRASWARPVPGAPLPGGYAAAAAWPERLPTVAEAQAEGARTAEQVEEALKNFALLVIEPLEVDYVELGVVPNRRTRFRREGEGWVEEIVVP